MMMEINQSSYHTWKVTNVHCNALWYSYWRTNPHAGPCTEKKVYIYNNGHINCGNDEKNQRFYNNQFGSYNSCIGITFKPTITQSYIQVFHKIDLSG